MSDVKQFDVDGLIIHVKDPNAVSTLANQGLTETEKANARSNIGAGASSFSGDYNDLTNKPTIGGGVLTLQLNGTDVQTFGANDTGNKTANFAIDKSTVGLTNVPNVTTDNQTPTFTQASTRANLVSGEKISIIFGKIMKWFSDLKAVAFSGSYNDLSDKPTIPTVNNATLTIQKNGTNVQTFTANQSTNATANISVPTKTSELTNDSGYTTNTGTVTQVKVGTTAYNPSSGVVSLPAYPTVNNATLTIQKNGTNVQTFTANQGSNATANITVPTKTSQLTNDSGYTTNTGTVTQVKVGSTAYNPSSGVVSLPAYPSVNNGTLTIQRNGTNVATFTANQSGNTTANISVPTPSNTQWYLFQDRVTSNAVTFPNGWKHALVTLRDNITGRAHQFYLYNDMIKVNTTFVGGYYYTAGDCGSFAIIVGTGTTGITGKSVTINSAVRAGTDTTISVAISA